MRRKSVLFIAILLIASMVLGACAQATEAPTEVPTEAPTEEVTEVPTEIPVETDPWADVVPAKEIVWWHQHTGEERETAIAEIVADFNATNEYGITLTAEYAGGYGDIFNKMLPLLNTPDVPDIVVGYQNQVATYQLADAMFDMNELIDHPTYGISKEDQADFIPIFFEQDVFPAFGNARLGLAPNRSMEVVFYNMDWLKELGYDAPPTTPEEFKEMACKASTTPFSGAKTEGNIGYELSVDTSRFASWTYAFGGDMFDYDNYQFTLDSDAAVEAWTFVQGLFKDGCARLVTENYGDQTDFGNGTLLFSIGSSSGLPYYKSAVDDAAAFEWSVAALPHTTADPVQNVYGASVSIPKSTPERELAAWIFIKYYTSPEVQAKWAEASGYFPVRQSVADTMGDFFAANPAYKTAFDLLQYGHFEPPVPGYDFVRDDYIEPAIVAIVDNPTDDVKTILAAANIEANIILGEQMDQMK
ncbi:MAG: extracellular solute-binding protein [Anaerolineaceae bacterium]